MARPSASSLDVRERWKQASELERPRGLERGRAPAAGCDRARSSRGRRRPPREAVADCRAPGSCGPARRGPASSAWRRRDRGQRVEANLARPCRVARHAQQGVCSRAPPFPAGTARATATACRVTSSLAAVSARDKASAQTPATPSPVSPRRPAARRRPPSLRSAVSRASMDSSAGDCLREQVLNGRGAGELGELPLQGVAIGSAEARGPPAALQRTRRAHCPIPDGGRQSTTRSPREPDRMNRGAG